MCYMLRFKKLGSEKGVEDWKKNEQMGKKEWGRMLGTPVLTTDCSEYPLP